jgi:hypothetical protein
MTRRAADGDTEAREWLEREDNVERSLGELEPADSAELVERLYRSGAVRVELQGLETYAADEDGATFRFELASFALSCPTIPRHDGASWSAPLKQLWTMEQFRRKTTGSWPWRSW